MKFSIESHIFKLWKRFSRSSEANFETSYQTLVTRDQKPSMDNEQFLLIFFTLKIDLDERLKSC